jgi:cardiolipin synthase
MWGELWQMLGHGVRVWLTPAPFDHTKLVVVDHVWAFIGSANIDPRSLRLNFELCLECHDPALVRSLEADVAERMQAAREITEAEYAQRGLPRRLRDGLARLWEPYL